MDVRKKIRENHRKIIELTESMSLWLNTPHARNSDVRAKILDLQDRTLFRLQELEVQGQEVKIANMEAVIDLLRNGA